MTEAAAPAPDESQFEIYDGPHDELPGVRPDNHRVVRDCTKCTVRDHHPRHTVWFPDIVDPRDPSGETMIDMTDVHHYDCGAAAGCSHCSDVMSESESAHGHALIAHLQAQPVNDNHAGLLEVSE